MPTNVSAAVQPKFSVQTITPDVAQTLLRNKVANRKINASRVAGFAAAMKDGRWEMNGETIKVSVSGKLQDGQHRLCAIIAANTPVDLMVIEGVQDSAIDTIDTGRPRRGVDVVTMNGYKHPYVLTVAANTLWRILTHAPYPTVVPPSYTIATIDRWPALKTWADRYANSRGNGLTGIISAASLLPALVYLDAIARRPDLAERLFTGLETGANLQPGDPIMVLRNRLIAMKGNESRRDAGLVWSGVCRVIEYLENGSNNVTRLLFTREPYLRTPEAFLDYEAGFTPQQLLTDLPAPLESEGSRSLAARYTSDNTTGGRAKAAA